ncbi:MAG TPA: aldose epimerase family protein [Opitutaceae bacterium]
MTPRPFGTLPNGEAVEAYTLQSASGACAEVLTWGCIIRSLRVPDRDGRMADVVLGFDSLSAYTEGKAYHGAVVGRIAGRVGGGILSIEGREFRLPLNEGPNHLHGGGRGIDRRTWSAKPAEAAAGSASVRLSYLSPDGEQGYPGFVSLTVTYTLTAENALVVETEATSDRPTPVSLAQHAYFNLSGEGSGTVLGNKICVHADSYVPAGDAMTPSDRRESVAGTPADLRYPRTLGGALAAMPGAHGELYLLRSPGEALPAQPTPAAVLADPSSGRVLRVSTNEACLQLYSGVGLGGQVGKSGAAYGPHSGLCLECEGYPHAGRAPGFGDILVRPGRPQRRTTVYAFSAEAPPPRAP